MDEQSMIIGGSVIFRILVLGGGDRKDPKFDFVMKDEFRLQYITNLISLLLFLVRVLFLASVRIPPPHTQTHNQNLDLIVKTTSFPLTKRGDILKRYIRAFEMIRISQLWEKFPFPPYHNKNTSAITMSRANIRKLSRKHHNSPLEIHVRLLLHMQI